MNGHVLDDHYLVKDVLLPGDAITVTVITGVLNYNRT